MYDTTDEAVVTAPGTLHNVVTGDQVSMTTTATYETAQPKKYQDITIRYAITGDIADYLAPVDSMTMGNIYDSIRVDEPFLAEALCEGTELVIGAAVSRGVEDLYKSYLTWDYVAHMAGLEDGEYYRFMPDGYREDGYDFVFDVPDTIRDGVYHGTLRLYGVIEGYYEDYPVTIQINGSTRLLDDIFTDVISIDNREERFFSYQWQRFNEDTYEYEDIPGATLPYYQEVGGLNGCYRVLLNEGTDTELLTCDRCFELPSEAEAAPVRKELRDNQVIIILPTGENYNAAGQTLK